VSEDTEGMTPMEAEEVFLDDFNPAEPEPAAPEDPAESDDETPPGDGEEEVAGTDAHDKVPALEEDPYGDDAAP